MTAFASLYGRLGSDPVARTSAAGKAWSTSTMAVQAGDDDSTLWVSVVAFNKVSDLLLRHSKGEPLSISGRLSLSRWTDKDGQQRERLQIIADSLISARTARPTGPKKNKDAMSDASPAPQDPGADRAFDDPIPF